MVYLSNAIVFSNKREQAADPHINTERFLNYYAEGKKLYTEEYMFTFTMNFETGKIIP